MILIIDSLFYRLWSDGRREKVTRCLAERDWCAVRAVTQAWRPKLDDHLEATKPDIPHPTTRANSHQNKFNLPYS